MRTRNFFLIVNLALSLGPDFTNHWKWIIFALAAMAGSRWLHQRLWGSEESDSARSESPVILKKAFVFGNEVDRLDPLDSRDSQIKYSEGQIQQKKIAAVSILVACTVEYLAFIFVKSAGFPWGHILLFIYCYFLTSAKNECDLNQPLFLSAVSFLLPISLGHSAFGISSILWLIGLLGYFSFSSNHQIGNLFQTTSQQLILSILKHTFFVFVLFISFFYLFDRPESKTSNSPLAAHLAQKESAFRKQFRKFSIRKSQSKSVNFENSGGPDSIEDQNGIESQNSDQFERLENEGEQHPAEELLSGDIEKVISRKSIPRISEQKQLEKKWNDRLDWIDRQKRILWFALTALIALSWFILRQSRKKSEPPKLRKISSEQRRNLRLYFEEIFRGRFSPEEEILKCYYGIEMVLKAVDLGRPEPLPPLHHQKNLKSVVPKISQELFRVINVYYSVLYGKISPSPTVLIENRRSTKLLLRQMGIYISY